MKNKTLLSFLLFSSLVWLPVLALTALQWGRLCFQENREERLRSNPLQSLSLPAAEAVWEEEGKELNIEGHLFDVATFQMVGNRLVVTGFFDEPETNLLALVLHHSGQKTKLLLHWILLLQVFPNILLLIHLQSWRPPALRWKLIGLLVHPSPVLSVWGPPPRKLFAKTLAYNIF